MTAPTISREDADAALTAAGQVFETGEEEIRGVRTRVWKNAPATLAVVLEQSRAHGDATFLVYEDERITFEEHYRRAAALAHVLVDRYSVEAFGNDGETMCRPTSRHATGAISSSTK